MNSEKPPAFVDANVLIHAFEKADSPKKRAARELLSQLIEEDRLRVSTQVLQDLYEILTSRAEQPCSSKEAMAVLEDLAAWPVMTVDYEGIRMAAALADHAEICFRAALVVVVAARCGAAVLYTDGVTGWQEVLGVEIRNPFAK